MKTTFKFMKYVISISKIRPFENDIFNNDGNTSK